VKNRPSKRRLKSGDTRAGALGAKAAALPW
jgi:hypothetical protein